MGSVQGLPLDLHDEELKAICRQYGVAQLALFGPVLRDDFTDHSDIDVLCTLTPDSPAHGLIGSGFIRLWKICGAGE